MSKIGWANVITSLRSLVTVKSVTAVSKINDLYVPVYLKILFLPISALLVCNSLIIPFHVPSGWMDPQLPSGDLFNSKVKFRIFFTNKLKGTLNLGINEIGF